MAEYRRDKLLRQDVIIAPQRTSRPNDYDSKSRCPFCAGQESETPPPVAVYPGQTGSWEVRVVPNKFPAVEPQPEVEPADQSDRQGVGVHEVIIECPDHRLDFCELTEEQTRLTFCAYQERLAALREHASVAYGLIFKNSGQTGGASLEHSHSQLLAIDHVPAAPAAECEALAEAARLQKTCPICALAASSQEQCVYRDDYFAILCPRASRFAYETWIVPCSHQSSFVALEPSLRDRLSHLVQLLVRQLKTCLNDPAYNYWIRSEPVQSTDQLYHWYFTLIPRVNFLAGFELGAGCFINPVAPEQAAKRLSAGFPKVRVS